jgi:hypothetical protein
MSNALDAFRAQREAVDEIRARLAEVAALLVSLDAQARALASNEALRTLLQAEQAWLRRTESLISTMRHQREWEVQRFWPAVWRRWAAAVALAALTAFAVGAGYVWAVHPFERELEDLRARVALMDIIAERVIKMTPTERHQFNTLMKWNEPFKK